MNTEEITGEPRQRFYVEDVAQFVEQALTRASAAERANWHWLPDRIRGHWAPFFWVTPSTKIADLVKRRPRRAA